MIAGWWKLLLLPPQNMMKLCSDGLRKRRRKMLPLEPFDTGRYYPGTEREREAVCSDQWWREGDVYPLIMWDFSKQTDRTGSYVLFLVVVDSDVCEAALCFLTVSPGPPTPPRGPSIPTSPCRQEEVSHFNITQQKLIFTARYLIKSQMIVTFSSKRSL